MREPVVELKELSVFDGDEIFNMIREIGPGENGFNNSKYDMGSSDFIKYLVNNENSSKGINLIGGYVPQTIFWLMVDDHPVGVGKLREYLNDKLRAEGGHIGYSIRPSERGKGYGIILLREVLKKAKLKSIPRVLLTCNETNIASRRVMENNGGVLEKIANGHCYYWIDLAEKTGIREIHIDDYDEIIDMWKVTPGIGLSNADSRENILNYLSRNRGLSYCYTDRGKIVGTALCGHDGRRGYLYHVAVVESYRGKGIGAMLVDKCLDKLKDTCIEKCHLFALADNDLGIGFWKASGWTKREDIFTFSKNTETEISNSLDSTC